MGTCSYCGSQDVLTRECEYCGDAHCTDHLLPENHKCPAVKTGGGSGKHFEGGHEVLDEENGGEGGGPKPMDVPEDAVYRSADNHADEMGKRGPPVQIRSNADEEHDNNRNHYRWLRFKNIIKVIPFRTLFLVLLAVMALVAFGPYSIGGIAPGPYDEEANDLLKDIGNAVVPASNDTRSTTQQPDEDSGSVASDETTDYETAAPTTHEEPLPDRTQIAVAIHERVNEIRAEYNLPRLELDGLLSTEAADHSARMAAEERLFHSSLSQYSCRVSVGENVAYTYADARVRTDSGVVDYDNNATAIGYGIVRQWMNSEGHRDNILTRRWEIEGVGVYIMGTLEGDRVYATQVFCAG